MTRSWCFWTSRPPRWTRRAGQPLGAHPGHARGAQHHGLPDTHYLDEAGALCDRILVIDNGRIVAQGAPDELKAGVTGDLVAFSVPAVDAARAAEIAATLPDAQEVEADGATVRFRAPRGDVLLPDLVRAIDAADIPLATMNVLRPTLDDVFLTLTGRSLRDAELAAEATSKDMEHSGVA